jgi:hypothetical protein
VQNFDPGAVLLISLQYGNMASHLQEVAKKTGITVLEDDSVDQLYNIDRFFAQVSAMDLVTSISNTTAHVSGSLGVPTWLMLPKGAGVFYYWFSDRAGSPWYPSVRVFRQHSVLDREGSWWVGVLDQVCEALGAWMSEPLPPRIEP